MASFGTRSLLICSFLIFALAQLIHGLKKQSVSQDTIKYLEDAFEKDFTKRFKGESKVLDTVKASGSHLSGVMRKGLGFSVRDFVPDELPGTYVGEANGTCPTKITFGGGRVTSVLAGGISALAYPVSSVVYNEQACTGNTIFLIKSSDVNYNSSSLLGKLAAQTVFLVIYNPKDVICGSFTYRKGRSLGFFDEDPIDFGSGATLPAGRKFIFYREQNGGCPLKVLEEDKGATAGSPSPAPVPSPTSAGSDNTEEGSGGTDGTNVKCFAADSEVQLESGEEIRMENLKVGDRIRVGPSEFSEVFLFTHRDPNYRGEFVKLTTKEDQVLKLTSGHYLYKNGQLAPAGSIRVGDYLSKSKISQKRVSKVEIVQGKGLYNPQTLHGDIVVNGVLASTFTEALEPKLARMLLKPFEILYHIGAISEARASGLFKYGIKPPFIKS